MSKADQITELRSRYVELTKKFFEEVEKGTDINTLQPLQQEIENTLLQLDELEKQQPGN